MRTTLDIDRELLETAMREIGARTKKQTVEESLRLMINERRRQSLINRLGKTELTITQEDLRKMREDE